MMLINVIINERENVWSNEEMGEEKEKHEEFYIHIFIL